MRMLLLLLIVSSCSTSKDIYKEKYFETLNMLQLSITLKNNPIVQKEAFDFVHNRTSFMSKEEANATIKMIKEEK